MASCGSPSLVELANFAKERSPNYRELYADLEIDEMTPWHAVPTGYIRRLTPAIRYPVGDRGKWVDREAGLFRVLARGGIAVRLVPVSLDLADLRLIVTKAMSPVSP